MDEKDKELDTTAQKLQEALSASAASGTTIRQLEDAVQKYLQQQQQHSDTSQSILSTGCHRYIDLTYTITVLLWFLTGHRQRCDVTSLCDIITGWR